MIRTLLESIYKEKEGHFTTRKTSTSADTALAPRQSAGTLVPGPVLKIVRTSVVNRIMCPDSEQKLAEIRVVNLASKYERCSTAGPDTSTKFEMVVEHLETAGLFLSLHQNVQTMHPKSLGHEVSSSVFMWEHTPCYEHSRVLNLGTTTAK